MGKRKQGREIPWIDKCFPQTIEDLAVQKKKITEVEEWLRSSLKESKKGSVLLLTGPPGAGKTVTVVLLCKILKAELFTWSNSESGNSQNPNVNYSSLNNEKTWSERENQVSLFSSFLLRCNKYNLFSENKRIILVEEFPNAFLRDPSLFHNIVRKYALSGRYPLIFIISDNTKGESIESRLFPADLKFTLKVTNISFNPITQAKLLKILNRINDIIQCESHYVKLTRSQLEDVASNCMGDIRNAINSLQFFAVSNFKKPKPVCNKSKGNSELNKETSQEHKRDNSLFLFHALGKILYCKRDQSLKTRNDILPSHLKHYERDPPLANAEDVYERTSLSADAFSLFLQENYLAFVANIEVTSDCSVWFSEADIFSSYWQGKDEVSDYTASIASRGLMFNLKGMSGHTWRPLHKPQFYDCIKKQTSLMATLRRTFKDRSSSFKELQTELIPFIQKLNCPGLRSDQSSVVAEIGEMKVKRLLRQEYKALKEKEVPNLEVEEFDVTTVSSEVANESLGPLQDPDEEIVIEEYDF